MARELIVALDEGTSNVKAVAIDTQHGHQQSAETAIGWEALR
ncbi:hypothetical protein [Erwinia sp. MYb535]